MNFEQKLLEGGSLELICAYVTEHSDIVSDEFKTALTEKVKTILQALNCEIPSSDIATSAQREILDMKIEPFIEKFYGETHRYYNGYLPHLPKIFFTQCRENLILTVEDLLKFGRKNVLKMERIGIHAVSKIDEAIEEAGLSWD